MTAPRRVLLLVGLSLGVVLATAVVATWRQQRAEWERELSRLRSLAALRARELAALPARAARSLERWRPAERPDLEAPPPQARPALFRLFFVLDGHGRVLRPHLPYVPDPPPGRGEESAPPLTAPEAFLPPEEGAAPLGSPRDQARWLARLAAAEEALARGDPRAAQALQELAAATWGTSFGAWCLRRALEAGLPGPAARRAWQRLAEGGYREPLPGRPLQLEAAWRLAREAAARGDRGPVAVFLAALLEGQRPCTRSLFERYRTGALALLGGRLPGALAPLAAEVALRRALVERILPALPPPEDGLRLVRRTVAGRPVYLAYRRAPGAAGDLVEGGLLDLAAPAAALGRVATPLRSAIAFAVEDAAGRRLAGPPPPLEPVARVPAGPGELFRVAAFPRDAPAFLRARRRAGLLRFGLLGVAALLGLLALLFANRALRREEELHRLKARFVAGVSHELRTPLTTLQMYAETLLLGRVTAPEHQRRYFRGLQEEAARLGRLVEDLLDFGRLEAGRLTVRPVPADAGQIARRAAARFRRSPRGRGRELHLAVAGPTTVRLDPAAVERALLNLLENAAKYSPPDRPIRLQVRGERQRLTFEVADQGVGIPRAHQRRVFEPFYRVPRRDDAGGTGLGLALVWDVVRAHGGRVRLRSVPGRGSRFRLTFPRTGPVDRAGAAPHPEV